MHFSTFIVLVFLAICVNSLPTEPTVQTNAGNAPNNLKVIIRSRRSIWTDVFEQIVTALDSFHVKPVLVEDINDVDNVGKTFNEKLHETHPVLVNSMLSKGTNKEVETNVKKKVKAGLKHAAKKGAEKRPKKEKKTKVKKEAKAGIKKTSKKGAKKDIKSKVGTEKDLKKKVVADKDVKKEVETNVKKEPEDGSEHASTEGAEKNKSIEVIGEENVKKEVDQVKDVKKKVSKKRNKKKKIPKSHWNKRVLKKLATTPSTIDEQVELGVQELLEEEFYGKNKKKKEPEAITLVPLAEEELHNLYSKMLAIIKEHDNVQEKEIDLVNEVIAHDQKILVNDRIHLFLKGTNDFRSGMLIARILKKNPALRSRFKGELSEIRKIRKEIAKRDRGLKTEIGDHELPHWFIDTMNEKLMPIKKINDEWLEWRRGNFKYRI